MKKLVAACSILISFFCEAQDDMVKAHGGHIKVQSKEGGGSEFIIKLPIA